MDLCFQPLRELRFGNLRPWLLAEKNSDVFFELFRGLNEDNLRNTKYFFETLGTRLPEVGIIVSDVLKRYFEKRALQINPELWPSYGFFIEKERNPQKRFCSMLAGHTLAAEIQFISQYLIEKPVSDMGRYTLANALRLCHELLIEFRIQRENNSGLFLLNDSLIALAIYNAWVFPLCETWFEPGIFKSDGQELFDKDLLGENEDPDFVKTINRLSAGLQPEFAKLQQNEIECFRKTNPETMPLPFTPAEQLLFGTWLKKESNHSDFQNVEQDEEWIGPVEAAHRTGYTRQNITNLRKQGKIRYKKVDTYYKYLAGDIAKIRKS